MSGNLGWILSYTGQKLYPLDPKMEDIRLLDIAHSLSRICRFNGHAENFYSVAEHSVRVSYLCPQEDQLSGLLHDSSEYLLCDLPSPLKHLPEFAFYREAELRLQTMIYKLFGCPEQEPLSVKKADLILLATESRDLMGGPLHPDWVQVAKPLEAEIRPMSPVEAKDAFLERFHVLRSERDLRLRRELDEDLYGGTEA